MKYKISAPVFGKYFTVPCSAVENYIRFADADFYKALLCALCTNESVIDSLELSKQCGLSVGKVEDALEFWSSSGVACFERLTEDKEQNTEKAVPKAQSENLPVCLTEAVNPMKKTASATAKVRYTTKELAEKVEKNKELKLLTDELQKIFGRPINHTETAAVLNLYEYYGFSAAEILIILQFCVDIGKKSMAYAETVAKDWFSKGITEYDQIEAEAQRQLALRDYSNKIKSDFGLEGSLTKKQREYFEQWQAWGFDEKIVSYAGEICRDLKGKNILNYINGIMKNWHEKGFDKLDDILKYQKDYKEEKNQEKEPSYDLKLWRKMAEEFDPDTISFEEDEA